MTCIVCGKETGDMYFLGTKGDMTVTFCKEHIHNCAECDKCTCNFVVKMKENLQKK